MKKNILLLTLLLFLFSLKGFTQSPLDLPQVSENVGIIGKSTADGIDLRWAPTRFSIWQLTANSGWVLERAVWEPEEDHVFKLENLDFKKLERLKAFTLDEFERELDISDKLVAVAAQALYGNEETRNMDLSGGFSSLKLMSEQQENRHALAMLAADMSADAAKGLGLSYRDTDVEVGKAYIYLLRSEGTSSGFGADSVYLPIIFEGIDYAKPFVIDVAIENNSHGQMDIIWNKSLNSQFFTAFFVERSENGVDFVRLNEFPVTTGEGIDQPDYHRYQDMEIVIGKTYFYRVIGITPFAEISDPSEVVEGKAIDLQGPVPPKRVSITQLVDMFSIEWEIPSEMIVPDAMGWIVKRSLDASGPYGPIHDDVLPLENRIFIDEEPIPVFTNYYRVYAIDTAYNKTPSMVYAAIWVDSIPPAAPLNVQAIIDTAGIVHIHWDQNTEIDLQGYRVFTRNDSNKEWYQMTRRPISQNFWVDTIDLSSLERSVEYTVIATDMHYNISEYALPFKLVLPDLVPPSPPRWAPWRMDKNEVVLNWYPSSSSDVFYHRLLKNKGNGWELYNDFYTTVDDLRISIDAGDTRHFALMAADTAGNVSDTVFLRNITSISYARLPEIQNIRLTSLEDENAILIEWNYPSIDDVSFLIYRKSLDSEEVEVVGTLQGNQRSYKDIGPTNFANGWHYHLKAVSADGLESNWSAAYTVTLNN